MGDALRGRHILVAEDDYLLAECVRVTLESEGASVLGPVRSVEEGLELLASHAVDGALLDISLRGQAAFPLADALARRGVAYSFCSGHDRRSLPARHANAPYCRKPAQPASVVSVLAGAVAAAVR